jgi:hypothetical protein
MKSRIVYAGLVALLACGMAWSQSSSSQGTTDSQTPAAQSGSRTDGQGDLPAVKEGESQSGKSGNGDAADQRPGSMGTPTTPDAGTTPKGETPATGTQTEQKGSAKENGVRPGVDTTNTDSSTPSQKSNGSGTESPNK